MDLSDLRLINLSELTALLSVGKSTIYQLVSDGLLPKPIHITQRRSVWPIFELRKILAARAACKPDTEVRELVRNIMLARQQEGA